MVYAPLLQLLSSLHKRAQAAKALEKAQAAAAATTVQREVRDHRVREQRRQLEAEAEVKAQRHAAAMATQCLMRGFVGHRRLTAVQRAAAVDAV